MKTGKEGEQGDRRPRELTPLGQRTQALFQRSASPWVLAIALLGIAAIWAGDNVWRSGLMNAVLTQDRAWSHRYVLGEAEFVSRRLAAIETALRRMGNTVADWQANPVESNITLTPRGQTWHAPGDSEHGEILIFSHRSIAQNLLASTGGDRFDPQAKGLLLADPALEAAGMVTFAGVLRRLPGSHLDDRIRDREQLLNMRAVRESAKTRGHSIAWYSGGGLSDAPPAQPLGAAYPVVVDGNIAAVLFVEADGARLLPNLDASHGEWTLIAAPNGTVLALDSLAESVMGRVGSNLGNNGQRAIAEFGRRLAEKPEGDVTISTRKGSWLCSYVTLQPQGWKLVLARPSGAPEGAATHLSHWAMLAGIGLTLFLLVATWLIWGRIRTTSRRYAATVDEIAALVETSIREVGKDVPLSVAGEERFPELEQLLLAIRHTARDVSTARQESERERERLVSILRSLDVGVAVMDRRFNVVYANDVILDRHGSNLVGQRASWIVEDNPWEGAERARQVMEDASPQTVRMDIPMGGEEREYQVTYFPMVSSSGRMEGFGEVTTDVTELARLKRELGVLAEDLKQKNLTLSKSNVGLQRADKLKTEFLGNISHELRTPLNAVLGYARILNLHTDGLDDKARDNLRRLEASATRLMVLIEAMLELARLDAGDVPLRIQSFPIHDLLGEVVKENISFAEDKGIDLVLNAPPGELIVRQDPERVRQIAGILIQNAVKFTEEGSVQIDILREGADLVLRFADTGVGIPSDELAHIFERFHQADGSVTRQQGGVGLGLTLAMRLTELLSGSIHVDSAEGEGTTFTVRLPRDLEPSSG